MLSGSGGLTAYYNTSYSGNVITELDAANTYTGNTYITGGSGTSTATLKLGASGSINNTPLISIGANGTFDVSAISSYTLSSSTTLSAAGTSLTGGGFFSVKMLEKSSAG